METPMLAAEPVSEHVPLRTWIALIAGLLGAFMAVLDILITNASLRDILGALSATQEEGSWIATAYLVAEIIVIPLSAFLVKVFSTRRYLIVNVSLFLIFSTLCGLAWNLESMIVFRALQGFTGGVMIPIAMTLISQLLPPSKQPLGFAMFGITATLAPTLGPTVGGWLTDTYGWQSIFFMNLVPGVLLLGGMMWGLGREPMKLDLLRQVDWLGIAAMAVGLGSLVAMLEEGNSKDWFESNFIRIAAGLTVFGLYFWVWRSLTQSHSFIDLRIFKRPSFLIASVIAFTIGLGLYGSSFVLPLYLGQIQGYTPMQIGGVIMWSGLPQLLILPLAAKLSTKIDNRILMSVGLLMFALSNFMNTTMSADTGGEQLIWTQVVRALGQPLIMTTLANFTVQGIPLELIPSASAMFNMMRNLGGAVGIALLSTMLTNREQLHSVSIGESVSSYNPATVEWLNTSAQGFLAHGFDPVTAQNMALKALDNLVRRESFIMAYNDAFLVMGFALAICIAVVWGSKKVLGGAAEGIH